MAGLLLAALTIGPAPAARADSGAVTTKAEAWYNVAPVAGPAGSPPVVPPTYGAGALHIGITEGQEDSRTYLALDLSSLPSDGTITGGTLSLPVDPGDGSRTPDVARLEACYVATPPGDAAGATGAPPAIDCNTASSTGTYLAGDKPAFTFDLDSFASVLRDGGIAVVPTPGAKTGLDTWHVAVYGRSNATAGVDHISASIEYTPAPVSTEPAVDTSAFDTTATATVAPAPTGPAPEFVGPPAEIGVAPEAAPPSLLGGGAGGSAVEGPAQLAGAVSSGFSYSVIWYLPLVLLALGWVLAWALTRSPVPDDA